ncbi:MAG: hypothetical protein IPK13_03265 [Deltaproteobacteria bacterium]|nr:hypothetical protein [Deltaproteobacteria bacterium]
MNRNIRRRIDAEKIKLKIVPVSGTVATTMHGNLTRRHWGHPAPRQEDWARKHVDDNLHLLKIKQWFSILQR